MHRAQDPYPWPWAVAARVVDGDQAGVVDLCGDPALADEPAAQLVRP
ncbi:hypothetical protein JHN53_36325 [Streptomyces sp. MBT58]|nr:hypothetical protein [Streptomyces sp. MBT58]MBK5996974.1 hypothetical protein [Streptomyces sp. MBT58]